MCYFLLFYLFSDEKVLLSGFPSMYQNKLQDHGVQDTVNMNKIKNESYGDLVDHDFLQFNKNLINNHDPFSLIENDETPGAEYPSKKDSEDIDTNKTLNPK